MYELCLYELNLLWIINTGADKKGIHVVEGPPIKISSKFGQWFDNFYGYYWYTTSIIRVNLMSEIRTVVRP